MMFWGKWLAKMRQWRFGLCLAGCLLLIGGAAFFVRSGTRVPTPSPPNAEIAPISMAANSVDSLDEALSREPSAPLWPISGCEILAPYSDSMPQYNKTLDLFALHEGIDIASTPGEAVLCAFDGEICAARKDPMLGYLIEVRREDGMLARYANLTSLNAVAPGERVRSGQTIGSVGASADGEALMPPHLHYALFHADGRWALDEAGRGSNP